MADSAYKLCMILFYVATNPTNVEIRKNYLWKNIVSSTFHSAVVEAYRCWLSGLK